MNIEDSVAVVTGGQSGLGRATSGLLSSMGARVVTLDLPSSKDPNDAAQTDERITHVTADVTDAQQVQDAVDHAKSLGELRTVVNCAGVVNPGKILGRNGPLALEAFENVLRVNLLGTFNVMRIVAAAMAELSPREGERGVIINTASIAAFDGQIGQPAYAASKGGVAAMTLPAARELAQHLIRVMAVAPGTFETPMMSSLPEGTRTALETQVPHPSRFGQPHEFASLIGHIVENSMLNGEVIRLDGAIRMPPR